MLPLVAGVMLLLGLHPRFSHIPSPILPSPPPPLQKKFKDKLIKERDDELELVISRLENESDSSQSDHHRKFRMDVEKLKSEHALEIKQLRDQHSMALDKIITLQHELEGLTESKKELQKRCVALEYEGRSKVGGTP
jgi:hypothetical protein